MQECWKLEQQKLARLKLVGGKKPNPKVKGFILWHMS